MLIDCDTCTARGTGCADCVVTVLLGAPPGWQSTDPVVVPMTTRPQRADEFGPGREPETGELLPAAPTAPAPAVAEDVVVPPPGVVVEFDEIERRAVHALASVGLVPPLRHRGQAEGRPADDAGSGRRTRRTG